MANLNQKTRIRIFGGNNNELMAYALIGYDPKENDSVVNLIRGTIKQIPGLLRDYGTFTREEVEIILGMKRKHTLWVDGFSQIIRLS